MRMCDPQVAAAIAALDCRRLPGPMVRELQANIPEEPELAALAAYLDAGGAVEELGTAEQLFAALRDVPRLEAKLRVRRGGAVGAGGWLGKCGDGSACVLGREDELGLCCD
jgi:hypothetical protein